MTHPFTPTYISMAKAAEEIQAGNHEQAGNYFDCDVGDIWIYPHFPDGEDRHSCDKWLPRLDQILGMLGSPEDAVGLFVVNFYGDRQINGVYNQQKSDWHELALAVVMRGKYGKEWRDGAWV